MNIPSEQLAEMFRVSPLQHVIDKHYAKKEARLNGKGRNREKISKRMKASDVFKNGKS